MIMEVKRDQTADKDEDNSLWIAKESRKEDVGRTLIIAFL